MDLQRLISADPIVNAVVASRVDAHHLESRHLDAHHLDARHVDARHLDAHHVDAHWSRGLDGTRSSAPLDTEQLGGTLIGADFEGSLMGCLFNGGNLMPVSCDELTIDPLAEYLASQNRVCSAIVGRSEILRPLWRTLSRHWSQPRLMRLRQPLLVSSEVDNTLIDPALRAATRSDLDRYLPAAAAMFTEELGLSPFLHMTRAAYRARLASLIDAQRAVVVTDAGGQVIFKAELAAVSQATCQIQGVWVRPDLRGHGIATAAMAGVLHYALKLAPTASLYVNDFNLPARRLYERLGMAQVATLSTILF